eukprot:620811-Pleurochrysis_carterae.AAC.1
MPECNGELRFPSSGNASAFDICLSGICSFVGPMPRRLRLCVEGRLLSSLGAVGGGAGGGLAPRAFGRRSWRIFVAYRIGLALRTQRSVPAPRPRGLLRLDICLCTDTSIRTN